MKKLFLASIVMLAMTTSCTNESREEIIMPQKRVETISKTTARDGNPELWEKPCDNPYDLDGYLHVVLEDENSMMLIFMGEKINPDLTEAGKEVIYLMNSGATSRRTALIYCKAQFKNFTISLVEVSGNNQPRTYWVVANFPDGHQEAYQGDADIFACGKLHFEAMFGPN